MCKALKHNIDYFVQWSYFIVLSKSNIGIFNEIIQIKLSNYLKNKIKLNSFPLVKTWILTRTRSLIFISVFILLGIFKFRVHLWLICINILFYCTLGLLPNCHLVVQDVISLFIIETAYGFWNYEENIKKVRGIFGKAKDLCLTLIKVWNKPISESCLIHLWKCCLFKLLLHFISDVNLTDWLYYSLLCKLLSNSEQSNTYGFRIFLSRLMELFHYI